MVSMNPYQYPLTYLCNRLRLCVPSLSALPSPTTTAVLIITPLKIIQRVLEEAKGLGIPAVWLQPGTFNEDVMAYAKENFGADVERGRRWRGRMVCACW